MDRETIESLFQITGKTARVYEVEGNTISFIVNEDDEPFLYDLHAENLSAEVFMFLIEAKQNETKFLFTKKGERLEIDEI